MTNPWAKPYLDLREATVAPMIDPKTGKPIDLKSISGTSNLDFKPGNLLNRYGAGQPNASYTTQKPSTTAFVGKPSIGTPSTTTPAKPIPANASPASASTAEKIKGGMEVYKQQIKTGDIKGAEQTGKDISALKYGTPEERKAKTIGTRNPLMDKTFGYQTGGGPGQVKKESKEIIHKFLAKEGYLN